MSDPRVILVGLVAGAGGVVVAGVLLARAGDVLAAQTRLGGLWFGLVFLALATSLPELVSAGAAVRIGALDLAAGDLFGSNMANMAILALLNLLPGSALFRRAALDQTLVASHAISLTSIAAATILITQPVLPLPVGPGTLLLCVAYVLGSRTLYRHTMVAQEAVTRTETVDAPAGRPAWTLRQASARFGAGVLLVLGAAPLLTLSAEAAAVRTGLAESFVGATVLGLATSLPELVTSLAAIRIGSNDLAVANLFGSNAINMLLFLPLDILHPAGPVLATVRDIHVFSALASVVMMSLALGAIVLRAKRRTSLLEPSSALILLTYVLALAVLFSSPAIGP